MTIIKNTKDLLKRVKFHMAEFEYLRNHPTLSKTLEDAIMNNHLFNTTKDRGKQAKFLLEDLSCISLIYRKYFGNKKSLNLENCIIDKCRIHDVKIRNTLFSMANIHDLRIDDCTFENCEFTMTKMSKVKINNTKFINCTFLETDFDDTEVWFAKFINCAIYKPHFETEADWAKILFDKCVLQKVPFYNFLAFSGLFEDFPIVVKNSRVDLTTKKALAEAYGKISSIIVENLEDFNVEESAEKAKGDADINDFTNWKD